LEVQRTRKKRQVAPDSENTNAEELSNTALAQGNEGPRVVARAKGVTQQEMVKTHGLPEPDGTLKKAVIFESILAPLAPGKLLDLGAGKGNFSLSAASLGWQVTAVDVRTVRWPEVDPSSQAEMAALMDAITFVQSDIREFNIGRNEYDLICILGLLHHLEIPDQINLIRKCAGTPLLIDTRIASAEIDSFGDYRGMLIKEHGETREERDEVATASWGNETSFRHTEESLTRLLRDAGYPIVFQARPPHRREYTFYFAMPRIKSKGFRREKRTIGKGRGGDLWTHYTPGDPTPAAGAGPGTD
jgi:2-polyprenyl-3-methyl-5-hydroxy-6-metoxy-1,4-benzoquinol methylase